MKPDYQSENTHKFMQTMSSHAYRDLDGFAKEKGITIQQLIRAIVIPEWLRKENRRIRAQKRKDEKSQA